MTGTEFRQQHGDPTPARELLARLKARKQATTDYQPAA